MSEHEHVWSPRVKVESGWQMVCTAGGGCRSIKEVTEEEWRAAVDAYKTGLDPGPWPLSFAEERILRGVAAMLVVGGRGFVDTLSSPMTPRRSETDAEYTDRLLAAARAAVEGPVPA